MKKIKHIFFAVLGFVSIVALSGRAFGSDAVYAVVHASDENGDPAPSAAYIEKQFAIKPVGTPLVCGQLKDSPSDLAGSEVHFLGCIDSENIWDFNIIQAGETLGTYPLDINLWRGHENQPVRFTNLPKNIKVKASVVRGHEIDPDFPVGTRLIWLDVKVGASGDEFFLKPKDLYSRFWVIEDKRKVKNPSTDEIRDRFAFKLIGDNSTQLEPSNRRDLGSGELNIDSHIIQTLIGKVGEGVAAMVTYNGEKIIGDFSVEPGTDASPEWPNSYILPGDENIWASFQLDVFPYPTGFNKDAQITSLIVILGDADELQEVSKE